MMGAKFFDLSYAQVGLTNFFKKTPSFRPTGKNDRLKMLVEQAEKSFYVWSPPKKQKRQKCLFK
jgi:hypothetical protein